MSTATQSRHEDAVDPTKTAKFLANLQRTVARRDPDDAPVSTPAPTPMTPPMTPVHVALTPPVATPTGEPSARAGETPSRAAETSSRAAEASSRAVPRRKGGRAGDKVQMEVTLDPGTASRVVYIRVDKTLADRLAVIAFQNKINGGESGPATINDIGVAALTRWIDDYEQAA